jgi:hypothetical protein
MIKRLLCWTLFSSLYQIHAAALPAAADCPPEVQSDLIESQSKIIIDTINDGTDKLYNEIKNEFLQSAFCVPENVFNNPREKISPVLFQKVYDDIVFVVQADDSKELRENKIKKFKDLVNRYQLSPETLTYGIETLTKYRDTSEGRFDAMTRIRGVMLQDMDKLVKKSPKIHSELIGEGLVERGIFLVNDNGDPVCPFIGLEAFREALVGREAVLKSPHRSKITHQDIITVVDYSRPSNERRMFIIDLKKKMVMHNTWVAHGGGVDRGQAKGQDGAGSSPLTSNDNGSKLSSEGFYIAKQASSGGTFLDNVLLEGIDKNNKSIASRGIVIHGWRTPNAEYAEKTWVMSENKNPKEMKRLPGQDIYKEFMSIDFKNTKEDLFDISMPISSAATARDYMDATDGCLGVTDTKIGHLDRQGRNKSQLELFREDLPGSLMFNFNGPKKTKSQYLEF